MKPFIFFSFIFLLSGSCTHSPTSSVSRATGIAYEVVAVMDKVAWESAAGEAVKADLISPVPYLPQSESSMRITYVSPEQFSGLFKYVRNILVVNIDGSRYTKASLLKESDKWARGQTVLYLNAPDGSSLEGYLAEHPRVLVEQFTKDEMKRTGEFLREKYSRVVMDKVKEKFGIELYAPDDLQAFKDSTDAVWFSNDAVTGDLNLLIYSFPYTDANTFTLEYLVARRDSVAKRLIPGSFPGSYMATEKRVADYFPSSLRGKYCGILRGLWRVEGDMMGGPFVSYARVDGKNRRVVVTEGFVYRPQGEKKNQIRRLEAALQTARFVDETEPETAEAGAAVEGTGKEHTGN
jgi:hypothetical protein